MSGEQLIFGALSVLMVVSSILMVHARHPVYSAIFMIATMFGVAGCFVLLDSFFLGVIQVLVYAGAIMVLFLFIIMLLNVDQEGTYQPSLSYSGVFLAAGFAGFLGSIIAKAHSILPTAASTAWVLSKGADGGSLLSVGELADKLFKVYWFPFEAISLLLLSAILGAVVLSKRRLE